MATRQVNHFAYGEGASAMAGSSNTCAPYNSLTAWLMTIFLTAVWYSSGCCASSAAVFTARMAVADMVCLSDDRFGIEEFQVGGEVGQAGPQFAVDGPREGRLIPV